MERKIFSFSFDIGDTRFNVSKGIGEYIDISIKFHAHSEWEMFFAEEDGLVLHTSKKQESYPYGTVLIVPPKLMHYADNYSSTFIFSFEKRARDSKGYYEAFNRLFNSDECIKIYGSSEYFWIWKEIRSSLGLSKEGDEIRLRSALELLFVKLLQSGEHSLRANSSRQTGWTHLYMIDSIINQRYNTHLTLKDIANELFLSERQVSRILHKNYGMGFPSILAEHRLKKAEILLKQSKKPISEVMEEVGFENESTFYTLFKKRYGQTPMQYRSNRDTD